MNDEQVKKLLKRRERIAIQFKEARQELPRSLFETICSFLNRDGGTILLGMNDEGKAAGVNGAKIRSPTPYPSLEGK